MLTDQCSQDLSPSAEFSTLLPGRAAASPGLIALPKANIMKKRKETETVCGNQRAISAQLSPQNTAQQRPAWLWMTGLSPPHPKTSWPLSDDLMLALQQDIMCSCASCKSEDAMFPHDNTPVAMWLNHGSSKVQSGIRVSNNCIA